jgi:ribosome-binding ATPase YchF (GTP1/OBG family)
VRAWTIKKGSSAPKAASVIHTDFEKGFIGADVISYVDFEKLGESAFDKFAKKMKKEGKDYIV